MDRELRACWFLSGVGLSAGDRICITSTKLAGYQTPRFAVVPVGYALANTLWLDKLMWSSSFHTVRK